MSVDKDDIEKIAHLARLGINDADVPGYTQDLNNILGLIEQMSAVDTTGVTPMAHPLDAQHQSAGSGLGSRSDPEGGEYMDVFHQRLRIDEVTESNQREQFQANAPQVDAGLFLVPQVIE